MIDADSFLLDSVEWLTILAVSVAICLLAMLILALLQRYSHSIRHLVIATLMVAHLFFLPCFLILPKLQFEVIPQSWTASVEDEVQKSPAVDVSRSEVVIEVDSQPDLIAQVTDSVEAEGSGFPIPAFQSNSIASKFRGQDNKVLSGSGIAVPVQPAPKPDGISLKSWLFCGWLVGFLIIASWFALAWLWAIRKVASLAALESAEISELLSSLCNQIGVRKTPLLKRWTGDRIPMMLGVFRPVVVLPKSFSTWPVSRQRHVLMHELTHIARLDSVHDSIAWLTSACFWFNPLVWVLKKHQATERELACDQSVVSISTNAEDYAADLLSVVKEASGFAPSTSIAMARNSELGLRIRGILRFDPAVLNRKRTLPRMLCGILVASAVLGSTLAFSQVALQEIPESQPEDEVPPFSLEGFASELDDEQRENLRVIQERLRSEKGERITTKLSATGRVVNSNGEPVDGATVFLRESAMHRQFEMVTLGSELTSAFRSKPRSFVVGKTKTDEKGEFNFTNIESPKHYEDIGYLRFHQRWAVVAMLPNDAGSFGWHWIAAPNSDEDCEISLPDVEPLVGVVKDTNGNAVAGATVFVDALSNNAPSTTEERRNKTNGQREKAALEFLQLGNSDLSPRTTTDAEGRFRIEGLPANCRARLNVSHPEMILASTDLLEVAGSESSPVAVTLDVGWKLKFLAKDTDGNPVADMEFTLRGAYAENVPREARPIFSFTTDEKGQFLSPPLAGCDVAISHKSKTLPKGAAWKPPKWISDGIRVPAGKPGTTVSCEMNFQVGKLIHGQIVPADKSAPITKEEFEELSVSFVVVSDDMFNNLEAYSARPDSSGRFAIHVKDGVEGQISIARSHKAFGFDLPGTVEDFLFTSRISQTRIEKEQREKRQSRLPFGAVVNRDESDLLESMPSRKTILTSDTFTSSSPIILPVARSKTIKGVLVDERGSPVHGAQIKMLNRRQVNYGADLQVTFPPDSTTDENGEFEITGVQERFVPVLRAIHPSNKDLTADFGWASIDEVVDKKIKLELRPGPLLKVIATLNGLPLSGQEVSLNSSFGEGSIGSQAVRKLKTDENGVCIFKNLARSKRNLLNIEHSQKDRYLKSISTLGDQMEFTISDVNFISEGSGLISGLVVDPSGKPIENVEVYAREHHEDRRTRSKFFEKVQTDAKGKFKLTKIPEAVTVRLELTPEYAKEARFPRSSMPSFKLVKSGDTDLRIIVDPRLSKELPWRSSQKESAQ